MACSLTPQARAYLVLALLLGLVMVFLLPPFQAPDEQNHFYRTTQIALGQLKPEKINDKNAGGHVPVRLHSLMTPTVFMVQQPEARLQNWRCIFSMGDRPLQPEARAFRSFPNSAIFSPLPYVPQVAGFWLGRAISDHVLEIFIYSRIMNLLACVALMTLAIQRTPVLKSFYLLLGLTPVCLQQFASTSPDGITISLTLLFLAEVFRAAFRSSESRSLSRREIASLVICGSLLGLVKQAYFPLILASLLIPVTRFVNWRRAIASFALLVALGLLLLGSWSLVVRDVYVPAASFVDAPGQVRYLLEHPTWIFTVLLNTITRSWITGWQFVGVMGSIDSALPAWIVIMHILVLIAACLLDRATQSPSRIMVQRWQRVLGLVVWSITWLGLFITIYITWMPVGADRSLLQGRYLIPMAPLLALLFFRPFPLPRLLSNPEPRVTRSLQLLLGLHLLVLWSVTFHTLIHRYYITFP